ncbi:hypothetical protein BC940DRAFT_34751 [Gongronella butleri]|nr:hypothetical protein BC940DRAFT_34751 [Gongronella butleri]
MNEKSVQLASILSEKSLFHQTLDGLDATHLLYLRDRIRPMLHQLLERDGNALSKVPEKQRYLRPAMQSVRQICDVCSTSLFNLSFVCRECAFEVCIDCMALIEDDQSPEGRILRLAVGKAPEHVIDKACADVGHHTKGQFLGLYRYNNQSIGRWERETAIDPNVDPTPSPNLLDKAPRYLLGKNETASRRGKKRQKPMHRVVDDDDQWATNLDNESMAIDAGPLDDKCATIRASAGFVDADKVLRVDQAAIDTLLFQAYWSQGKPLVVSDVMSRSKANWSPAMFCKLGQQISETVEVHDCHAMLPREVPIDDYFDAYTGKAKLKTDATSDEPVVCELIDPDTDPDFDPSPYVRSKKNLRRRPLPKKVHLPKGSSADNTDTDDRSSRATTPQIKVVDDADNIPASPPAKNDTMATESPISVVPAADEVANDTSDTCIAVKSEEIDASGAALINDASECAIEASIKMVDDMEPISVGTTATTAPIPIHVAQGPCSQAAVGAFSKEKSPDTCATVATIKSDDAMDVDSPLAITKEQELTDKDALDATDTIEKEESTSNNDAGNPPSKKQPRRSRKPTMHTRSSSSRQSPPKTLLRTLNREYSSASVLKIKDWPPSEAFVKVAPHLFHDYMDNILPVPEYCADMGRLNLASYLSPLFVKPDVGPKLFIAFGLPPPSVEDIVGTTNIHCDMSDAVNVICHSQPNPYFADITDQGLNDTDSTGADNKEVVAVWHVFKHEDMSALRAFLTKLLEPEEYGALAMPKGYRVFRHLNHTNSDPLHGQWVYLNEERLTRLRNEYGVVPWTIYQKQGDAVYVPAGCAHQVRNVQNAIKCAYDFLSPENIHRSAEITRQYAECAQEDVLQLKSTLLCSWLTTSQIIKDAQPKNDTGRRARASTSAKKSSTETKVAESPENTPSQPDDTETAHQQSDAAPQQQQFDTPEHVEASQQHQQEQNEQAEQTGQSEELEQALSQPDLHQASPSMAHRDTSPNPIDLEDDSLPFKKPRLE